MARSTLSLVFSIALALWQTQTVRAADVNYQFNIINADIATDGFTRNAILVNNQFPGTLIQANKEDTLHMNVSVQLTNPAMRRSTSIHVSFLSLHIRSRRETHSFLFQSGTAW
jgi:iron transport multicopper oxidase